MPNQRGTAQYRYRAGFDGISEFGAIEISGGGEEHEKEQFRQANSTYAENVSGQVNVKDVTIKLVIGHDQNAIDDLNRWFDSWFSDEDKTRRSGYMEALDEAGTTPVMAKEFVECIPVSREEDNRSTEGKGVATITFVISPTRVYYIS